MFAGFLRFDEVYAIRFKDVTVYEDHLTIHLPKSKVDALRLGEPFLHFVLIIRYLPSAGPEGIFVES